MKFTPANSSNRTTLWYSLSLKLPHVLQEIQFKKNICSVKRDVVTYKYFKKPDKVYSLWLIKINA